MTEAKRKTAARKAGKTKANKGQKSLLEHFGVQPKPGSDAPAVSEPKSNAVDAPEDTEAAAPTPDAALSMAETDTVEAAPNTDSAIDVETISEPDIIIVEESDGADPTEGVEPPGRVLLPKRTEPTKMTLRPKGFQPAPATTPGVQEILEGSTREAAIVVDSSPVKPTVTAKPIYSIFARRQPAPPVELAPSPDKEEGDALQPVRPRKKLIGNTALPVPFPDAELQHTRGLMTTFVSRDTPLQRRDARASKAAQEEDPVADWSLSWLLDEVPALPSSCSASALASSPVLDVPSSPPPSEPITIDQASDEAPHTSEPDDRAEDSAATAAEEMLTVDTLDAKSQFLDNIPAPHRLLPAISRLFQTPEGNTEDALSASSETWTDRWRPRRAEEVLGNQDKAAYLRAWLLALKLQIDSMAAPSSEPPNAQSSQKSKKLAKHKAKGTNKRPLIVRQAERPKKRPKRSREDAWIAHTDEEDADDTYLSEGVEEDELAFCEQTLSRLRRRATDSSLASSEPEPFSDTDDGSQPQSQSREPRLGKKVFNTILLAGPHGCGKTAAVYACAEELGWDVFEVYPGTGERSGASLNKLIGEVGKNHLVRGQRPRALPFGTVGANAQPASEDASAKPAPSKRRLRRIESEDELLLVPAKPADPVGPEEDVPHVRQSIVLIEEADVLFESDVNFWPTLVSIIKESRRPVVLTCNDVSTIPLKSLPLQTVLTFAPCPEPLATSYLQCLSSLSGRDCSRPSASSLYAPASPLSRKQYPQTHAQGPRYDLRHSIHQLQLGLMPGPSETRSHGTEPSDNPRPGQEDVHQVLRTLKTLDRCQDLVSSADSFLSRGGLDSVQTAMVVCSPPADDELGYFMAHEAGSVMESGIHVDLSIYHGDEALSEELAVRSRECCAARCASWAMADPGDEGDASASVHEHRSAVTEVLGELKVPVASAARGSGLFMDYEPWLRFMVAIDDAEMEAERVLQQGVGARRTTRNSTKGTNYHRRIYVRREEGLRTVRELGFPEA